MKVVNLDFYRRQRDIKQLELEMQALATQAKPDPNQLKNCFVQWLLKTGRA